MHQFQASAATLMRSALFWDITRFLLGLLDPWKMGPMFFPKRL
jgi:hypothetical protein